MLAVWLGLNLNNVKEINVAHFQPFHLCKGDADEVIPRITAANIRSQTVPAHKLSRLIRSDREHNL